jgi:hypothetical protein
MRQEFFGGVVWIVGQNNDLDGVIRRATHAVERHAQTLRLALN